MTFGNCWIYALRKWWQEGTADSYLIVRRSRHTWIWHVMWAPSISETYVEDFKPLKSTYGRFTKWFPVASILFRGRVRRGVGEEGMGTKVGR